MVLRTYKVNFLEYFHIHVTATMPDKTADRKYVSILNIFVSNGPLLILSLSLSHLIAARFFAISQNALVLHKSLE